MNVLSNVEDHSALQKREIIFYSGRIDIQGADEIHKLTSAPKQDNVLLILCTYGGDPNAAYKIARRLQDKYLSFSVYIPGYCKSAGTLIAIGANELIMGDFGELGPLDVQLPEKDEFYKSSSGLNLEEAIRGLRSQVMDIFSSACIELADAGLSTTTAADLAISLATQFITPMVSQIDPLKIGATRRDVKVAQAYGERLLQKQSNLKSLKVLTRLIEDYPSHGFVIDFQEARDLFNRVRRPSVQEELLAQHWKIKYPLSQKVVKVLLECEQLDNLAEEPDVLFSEK